MAKEIERRFLVTDDAWRAQARRDFVIRQGYLHVEEALSVRARISGERAWITVKGRSAGASRSEFEYAVPVADAEAMLAEFCADRRIDKRRHEVLVGEHVFEVDVFEGKNAGLTVAEVELATEDEHFERPVWLGAEVTELPRYLNARLAIHPFVEWSVSERAAGDAR